MSVHDSDVVDVGTPPQNLNDWETKVVRFHGFANLPRSEYIYSPEFTCCGYQWVISIDVDTNQNMDVRLHNMTNEDVTVEEWTLSMRNSNGNEVAHYTSMMIMRGISILSHLVHL